jgi:hypothetical protein
MTDPWVRTVAVDDKDVTSPGLAIGQAAFAYRPAGMLAGLAKESLRCGDLPRNALLPPDSSSHATTPSGRGCSVATAVVRADRLRTTPYVAFRSSAGQLARDCLVAKAIAASEEGRTSKRSSRGTRSPQPEVDG